MSSSETELLIVFNWLANAGLKKLTFVKFTVLSKSKGVGVNVYGFDGLEDHKVYEEISRRKSTDAFEWEAMDD